MLMKRGVLAEPVMTGLEKAVSGSEVYPDCLLGGFTYVFPPCASELIPCRQSCSAQKSDCKDKCLEAVACHMVVEPRVPDRGLVEPGYHAVK